MIVFVKPQRKDMKTPVTFKFNNGVLINKLIPCKDYANMEEVKAKHPTATFETARK